MRLHRTSASDRMWELRNSRAAFLPQRQEQAAHGAPSQRVEPGQGLVEEDDLGVVEQSLGHTDPLQHPARAAAERQAPLRVDPDAVQQSRGPPTGIRRSESEQAPVVDQEFLGREVLAERGRLGQEPDAAPHGDVAGRTAQDLRAARGGKEQLHEQLQGRRLTGAVRTEIAEDLARCDVERDALQRRDRPPAPEADVEVLGQGAEAHGSHVQSCGPVRSAASSCAMARSKNSGARPPLTSTPLTTKVGVASTGSAAPTAMSAATSATASS